MPRLDGLRPGSQNVPQGRRDEPPDSAFERLVDSVRDCALVLLDHDGSILSWNLGAQNITGYSAEEAVGRNFSMLHRPVSIARGWPQHELHVASTDRAFQEEGWRVRKDGFSFWADVTIAPIEAEEGWRGFSMTMRDLTDRKHAEEHLQRTEERSRQLFDQAVRDPLTGAFNRRHMLERLRRALDDAHPAALLLVDIDRFKSINDRFGHEAGDAVLTGLVTLAERLSRDTDIVFRTGGDEFVLLLPGVSDTVARVVAERLRAAVENANLLEDGKVSVSIGIAELRPGESVEAWQHRADMALYAAKHKGRNRVATEAESEPS